MSQNNPDIFGELFKHGGNNIPNMLNLSNDGHLLQSSFNAMPNLNYSQPQQVSHKININLFLIYMNDNFCTKFGEKLNTDF